MFTLGQRPRGNPSAVWYLSTTTADAINREPLRMATGAPAAPTPADHNTAYPGGGASKNTMAVAIAIFRTARSPKQHENRGIEPKHHARGAKNDSFLACAAKKRKEAGGGAHAMTHAVALVCSRRCLSPGRYVKRCVFPVSFVKKAE